MEGAESPMVAEKALPGSPINLEAALDAMGDGKRVVPVKGGMTAREIDSLRAVCDTLLPSINLNRAPNLDVNESISSFYQTSASMLGTPEVVGDYISNRMRHSLRGRLRIALWLLSTWYGSLIFCGRKGLSSRFPHFQKFSSIDQQRREEIMLQWAHSSLYLYSQLFRALKFLVFHFYFTQVNEKNENPTWKGLDYCGPDPEHTEQVKSAHKNNNNDDPPSVDQLGPLHKGLVYMDSPKDSLSSVLSQAGISLTTRPHPKSRHSKPVRTIQCDAVIVGSGSGGGVVAGVLAQAGYKVVVLEKGNYHARHNLKLLEGQAMEQMYEGTGLLVTKDMGVAILAGSTVGGGSTINWGASLRTPEHVVSEWRNQQGIELFGSDAYAQALDRVCCRMGVQHDVVNDNLNNSVLRRGCTELGYPVKNIPRNAPPDHYCGWCCFGCKDGRKKGTCETWLVDLLDSGNGVILPGCKATKVMHAADKGRKRNVATGVMFEYENGWSGETETCIVESKVTVVACGALATPILLKESRLKNPNIGKNLHLHPAVMVWGYFPETETGNDKKSYEGGIMTAMSTVVSNSSTTGYGAIIQTPQLHPGMFSVATPWLSGMNFKGRMTRFAHTSHIFALARDKGSGTVESMSSIKYNMESIDEENLRKGVEKMLRILAAAGAVEIGTSHCKGEKLNVKTASSHEFEKFVNKASKRELRGLSTPIFSAHQMGSCRMGVNPETSAVNPNGETWEVEGLYVADTSVFPTALGVNPMVTVQAIAYCTAHSVLEVLRRKIRKNNTRN